MEHNNRDGETDECSKKSAKSKEQWKNDEQNMDAELIDMKKIKRWECGNT